MEKRKKSIKKRKWENTGKKKKKKKISLNLPCIVRPNRLFTVAGGGDQAVVGDGARFHAQRIAGGARLPDAPAEGGGQLDKVRGGEFLVCGKRKKEERKQVSKLWKKQVFVLYSKKVAIFASKSRPSM